MGKQNSNIYGKQTVILILSVFIIFASFFNIGAFRSNSPLFEGDDLHFYTSIVNQNDKTMRNVRVDYVLFNPNGDVFRPGQLDAFDTIKRSKSFGESREIGTSSVISTQGLDSGEYFLQVSAYHKGNSQRRYLPVDVFLG
tara:strand:+ start:1588 stop:2007 length:420 start_codon:yes stop_codon:yes gene_type:complete